MAVRKADYSAGAIHVNSKHQGRKIKELYYDGCHWRVKWRECYSVTDIEYQEVGPVRECFLRTFRAWKGKVNA